VLTERLGATALRCASGQGAVRRLGETIHFLRFVGALQSAEPRAHALQSGAHDTAAVNIGERVRRASWGRHSLTGFGGGDEWRTPQRPDRRVDIRPWSMCTVARSNLVDIAAKKTARGNATEQRGRGAHEQVAAAMRGEQIEPRVAHQQDACDHRCRQRNLALLPQCPGPYQEQAHTKKQMINATSKPVDPRCSDNRLHEAPAGQRPVLRLEAGKTVEVTTGFATDVESPARRRQSTQ
jgi:hypothetical protein